MANVHSLEQQTSGTAMATAYMRALSASDPREEIRGSDDLAKIFLTGEQRNSLKDPVARAWVLQNRITPGAYEFMLARTLFFDQIVKDALLENNRCRFVLPGDQIRAAQEVEILLAVGRIQSHRALDVRDRCQRLS